jgi:hypothetical protein
MMSVRRIGLSPSQRWPGRGLLSACVWGLGLLSLACVAGAGREALAQATAPPQQGGAATSPLVIEFELPGDFWSRPADGAGAVTGFRVGYFTQGDLSEVATVEVPREAMEISGDIARVVLDAAGVPQDRGALVLRVQTVSGNQSSVWSGSVPLATQAPVVPPQVSARATATSSRQRRRGLVAGDIDSHPPLGIALRQVVPPDMPVEAALGPFRQLNDVALAVVISRDHGVPFAELLRELEGPPPRSLRNTIRRLEPDLDRRALTEARRRALALLAIDAGRP